MTNNSPSERLGLGKAKSRRSSTGSCTMLAASRKREVANGGYTLW